MRHTPEQEQFIRSTDKRIILNAAAGTGKTTSIARRCEHLIERDPDQQIMVTTFTHAARNTIEKRVQHLDNRVMVRTVVSLALNVLKAHRTIAYVGDGKVIARAVCDGSGITADDLTRYESLIKNDAPISGLMVTELLDDLYRRYEDTKEHMGYLTYADIVVAARGLRSPHMDHLIVDEAQDLSATQWLFLNGLGAEHLVLAGDPLQSIYGFNGANPYLLPSLVSDPAFTHMQLTQSHRVPEALLPVVNSLRPTPLTTSRSGGVLSIVPTAHREQNQKIADLVAPGDVVLVRTNAQCRTIREQITARYPALNVSLAPTAGAGADSVLLTTIHSYKGSEADHVIVADVDTSNGGYRLTRFRDSDQHTDDMLLYVAATRATNRLTLMEVKR